MLSIICFLSLQFLAHASAQNSYEQRRICSDRLNDVMMAVCEGVFNGVEIKKRGMIASSDLDPLDPIQYAQTKESHPLFGEGFQGGEGVPDSLAPIRRLTRQGIVDRCCKRSCPYDVLMEYCSAPLI